MSKPSTHPNRRRWIFIVLALSAAAGFGWFTLGPSESPRHVQAADHAGSAADEAAPSAVAVDTVRPRQGDMDRTTTQPGSVQAFESIQLYAGVTGRLKYQPVDIGDHVKADQVLAIIDVPDIDKEVQRYQAAVKQAKARALQMQSRVDSAKADLDVAEAAVTFAEANAKSKAAELRFREKQLSRMKDLFALKSIDERLVDEKTEQRDTAQEAERAARASIISSKAQVIAAKAKVAQAEADLVESEAAIDVAQGDVEKEQAIQQFATIKSPCDGVITQRTMFPGDYVRKADSSGQTPPMLVVQCNDRFRVVVQVPDRDVPFTQPGDPAELEFDALPDHTFPARVSRISEVEDPQTRLMRIEIDLRNKDGLIHAGMYGRVKILLQKSDLLSVPTSALAEKPEHGRSSVFVVRDGIAHRVGVRVSEDNGIKVGILSGLHANDVVVNSPPQSLTDGSAVQTNAPNKAPLAH